MGPTGLNRIHKCPLWDRRFLNMRSIVAYTSNAHKKGERLYNCAKCLRPFSNESSPCWQLALNFEHVYYLNRSYRYNAQRKCLALAANRCVNFATHKPSIYCHLKMFLHRSKKVEANFVSVQNKMSNEMMKKEKNLQNHDEHKIRDYSLASDLAMTNFEILEV